MESVPDREYSIDCVLPPNEEDTDLENLHCVSAARAACKELPGDNEAEVVEDEELGKEVIELMGLEAELVLPTSSILPMLVLHVKSTSHFFWICIDFVDNTKKYRTFTISNKQSIVSVDE
mmetsp:Transcript_20313/g.61664  ORF Transcript_20313/g.61664 Transcript_20313/m.61664 type:complete len:120 (+) Transcript_20313:232-591(+)